MSSRTRRSYSDDDEDEGEEDPRPQREVVDHALVVLPEDPTIELERLGVRGLQVELNQHA